MTHFAFLETEWAEIATDAKKAEAVAHSDPRTACFYARRALELSVQWLYRVEPSLKAPYDTSLSSMIHTPEFRKLVGPAILTKAKLIKDLGNTAVHTTRALRSQDGPTAVRELFHFTYWLARTYGRKSRPDPALAFRIDQLPVTPAPSQTQAQLQKLEEQLAERDRKLEELAKGKASLEAEIAAERAAIAAAKAENAKTPGDHDYSEAETRDAFIDLLLREAGWALSKPEDREYEVQGMPNSKGVGFVDYVLWGTDGKPLAVVEAKRTKRDPREGQQQAKLYADCLERKFNQRPIIYYTNGYEHWMWDDLAYPARAVQGFHKRDELELMIQRRKTRQPLKSLEISSEIVERHYQTRAIRKIGEAFETDCDRKALVVMATGAGKTRTVIALADLLMRANWAKRVLFLADRVALVNQAVKAFKAHLPSAAPVNLVTEKAAQGRVYVSTYPTMMGLINEVDGERRFGVGHFDLIVVDEAHRSIYQKYSAIFDYFDSLLVGLTATPTEEVDHNTYKMFDLEDGVPTDAYVLDEAVRDGFLVPPKSVSVPLRFLREGMKYDERTDEEKERWDEIEWDEDGNIPDEVSAAALNQWLFNTSTVDAVLATLMTDGLKVAGGDRIGKTIVFAKNHDHAVFIQERFDKAYPHLKGHYARVIDFKTEYAQSLIDDFSKKDSAPHIAISVDMLDTGIDVPEIVNLVFFKIVRSKTKFWQMIGRGTRLCPNLFGPDQHKTQFAVFDFCGNLEFFSQNPDAIDKSATASIGKRLFAARLSLIAELDKKTGDVIPGSPNGLREEGEEWKGQDGAPLTEEEIRKEFVSHLRGDIDSMNLDNFVVRPKRQYVEGWRVPAKWDRLTDEERHELVEHVADLPTEREAEDEEVKRFDLMVFNCELALLRNEKRFEKLRDKIKEIAEALEAQSTIPMVAAELDLIQELQTDAWWQDVTLPMLERTRKRLRLLVRLVERSKKKIVYTDFEDELGASTEIVLPGVPVGMDFERFKAKARYYLKSYEDHVAVHKLRLNQPLTPMDLTELERILHEVAGGNDAIVARVREAGLALFVRSLVGLDRTAAKQAFGKFLDRSTLSGAQHHFLNMVIDHLTQNGAMEPDRLYESPFTDANPSGVAGIFPAAEVTELIAVLETFKANAA